MFSQLSDIKPDTFQNTQKKILVIEDDFSIQQVITDILENEGYKVFSAYNGKAGIQLANEILPDLIICDILMPVMDGYQVISTLSENKNTALIPFIFLSAKIERSSIRHGMELGADDYLTKPFKMDELLKAVEVRLKRKNLLSQINDEMNDNHHKKMEENDHIFLKYNNQPQLVKINSIICITSFVDYTYVYTSDKRKTTIRRLLKQWEDILPEKKFIRIHRSAIINVDYVEKVDKNNNNTLSIYIKHIENPFIISRRFYSKVKAKLHFK